MILNRSKTLLATIIIPLALGCKREPIPQYATAPATPGTPIASKVQQWLKQQPLGISAQGRSGAANTFPKHTIQWEQTRQHQGQYIVPMALEGNTQPNLQAALTASEDVRGHINGGQYVAVIADAKTGGQAAAQDWIGQLALSGEAPGHFSGAVLYYNTAGALTASKVYKNGQLQRGASAKLVHKKPTSAPNQSGAKASPAPGSAGYRPPSPCSTELLCIDWYWQTFVDGILVHEEYLYTSCECPLNGGGGSGGGPMEIDESQQLMEQFNQHIQFTSTPATAMSPFTEAQPEPYTFTHTWTVAQALVANWKVLAKTRMDYYHNVYYDITTNSLEHRYRISFFKTLNTWYQGSNITITTTWTPSAVLDNIYNNNTSTAVGVAEVSGTLTHKANFSVTLPLMGTITPQSSDGASNSCRMTPK